MEENEKEIIFVRSNLYALYEWGCFLEDGCRRFKKIIKNLELKVQK